MHLIPRVILRAEPEVDSTLPLTLTASSVVRRGFLHLLLDPFAVTDLSWTGVSLLVARFNCTLDKNLAIIELPEAPEDINFCLCVAWKTGEGTAERFKLWAGVGEKLYAPLYDGRRIPSIFWLEVWSCLDETDATLASQLSLKTSLVQLGDLSMPCVEADTEELITATLCHDNTWELLVEDNPIYGDYWTFNDCGDGTFVDLGSPEPPPAGDSAPEDYDFVLVWFDAENLAVTKPGITDGQAVGVSYPVYSGWHSMPPSAPYIAYQASSGFRPVYKTNIMGSKPGVLFADDQLPAFTSLDPAGVITLAVVCKQATQPGVLFGGNKLTIYTTADNKIAVGYNSGSGWTVIYSDVLTAVATDARLLIIQLNFATGQYLFRENKAAKGSGSFTRVYADDYFTTVCADAEGTDMFGGYVFEWIVWYQGAVGITAEQFDGLYDDYYKPKWSELP